VGRTYQDANQNVLLAGDPLPVRLRRSRTVKDAVNRPPARDTPDAGPNRADRWIGHAAGVAIGRLPRAHSRRATLTAPGAPCVFPAGQPLVAAAGLAVHGVGMLLPR
jgi:hypothetical protein